VSFYYNGRRRMSNTLDLSISGARIETVFPMKIGDVLKVAIVVGGKTVSTLSRVVHGEELPQLRYNAGFNFETLDTEDRVYLLKYLRNRSGS
jgi:hypothetical protein